MTDAAILFLALAPIVIVAILAALFGALVNLINGWYLP